MLASCLAPQTMLFQVGYLADRSSSGHPISINSLAVNRAISAIEIYNNTDKDYYGGYHLARSRMPNLLSGLAAFF